jgi:hypothetical protein
MMVTENLQSTYLNLSPNYQRILTKFKQDPVKFQANMSWAKPLVDAIEAAYPGLEFTEAVYRLKTGIKDAPTCLECDATLPLIKEPRHHYGKFCNNICSARHREASKKTNFKKE